MLHLECAHIFPGLAVDFFFEEHDYEMPHSSTHYMTIITSGLLSKHPTRACHNKKEPMHEALVLRTIYDLFTANDHVTTHGFDLGRLR